MAESTTSGPQTRDVNATGAEPLPPDEAIRAGYRSDPVNHPAHYTAGKVECIDALEAATIGLIGIEAVCTASAIKYLWRWKMKGGLEDLRKARWYINRLLGEVA